MKLFVAASVLLFVSQVALADEPPSYADYTIRSANGKFVAEVKNEGKQYAAGPYRLTVYELTGKNKAAGKKKGAGKKARRVVWSARFAYDGYPEGHLADDGQSFVRVAHWFERDRRVVDLYRNGKKRVSWTGAELGVSAASVRRTESHQVWLAEDPKKWPRFATDKKGTRFEIETYAGKVIRIDPKSARLEPAP